MKLRSRMVLWFSGMVFVVMLVVCGILILGIDTYYGQTIEHTLVQQAKRAQESFNAQMAIQSSEAYFDVTQQFEQLYMRFIQYSAADFQLLDANGYLVDEAGNLALQPERGLELLAAEMGEIQAWRGKLNGGGASVLAISIPLLQKTEVIGFARYITSLEPMNSVVWRYGVWIVSVAALITAIATLLCILIAGRIVEPIQWLESATLAMAAGDTGVRAVKRHEDEVGQLADSFNQMIASIEDKERIKNVFIASVSHELRTPLTSILGWAVTLKHEKENEQIQTAGLDIIEEECQRLAALVDQLLDFSKLESGSMALSFEAVDLQELHQRVFDQMKPIFAQAEIGWRYEGPEAGVFVRADQSRLKQVLINIIDNAVKFTGAGGSVLLRLKVVEANACIEIVDTGCGISDVDLPLVFDKFYKGSASQGGSGIGLSICKSIVERHGGRIAVESQVGLGTTFRLWLPVTIP